MTTRQPVGSNRSFSTSIPSAMAMKKILRTVCTPSPLALAASAVLHAWAGNWIDTAAALTFFVVKVAALAWARHWTGAAVAKHGLEDAPSDSERVAIAAGHGCILAGAGLAFYLFLAEDESPPTRALGRSLVVFNISLLPGALPLAVRLRLVQAATSMIPVAQPQGLDLIERTARIQTLFVCDNLAFEVEATALEATGVRCVLLTGSAEVDGPVVLAENMWPASHRRDSLLRECRCIVTDNANDIQEALLVALQGRAAVGIHLGGASFTVPPGTIAFGEHAGVDFHTDAGLAGVRSAMTQDKPQCRSLYVAACASRPAGMRGS